MSVHTICIVDDNQQLVEALTFALTTMGDYTITSADNGLTGLETIQSVVPDCAIIDVVMPKMNGYALITALRQSPITARIPIIILSAKTQAEDQRIGYMAGADLCLTKPIDPVSLCSHIESTIHQQNAVQA